uniref:Homeobox protein abdominal-B n=1 Tax=Macrostomum lignano TaxID=282301 RepID=A0A1I8GEJ3_9PLAT
MASAYYHPWSTRIGSRDYPQQQQQQSFQRPTDGSESSSGAATVATNDPYAGYRAGHHEQHPTWPSHCALPTTPDSTIMNQLHQHQQPQQQHHQHYQLHQTPTAVHPYQAWTAGAYQQCGSTAVFPP